MSDFVTTFGRRQDALKSLYTHNTSIEEDDLAPQRPLGNIDLIGSVLIDLHHRHALMQAVAPSGNANATIANKWEAVKEIAEWEWALMGPAVIAKVREKQQEGS